MLVKEIKILLFYYQQSEFPCCRVPGVALLCLVLHFLSPTCLFMFGLVCMWQNLFKFSTFVVGLNLQISHFFPTHYNCLESLRIIVASVFMNNFWSILHISKTTEHISETLLWKAVDVLGFFLSSLLLMCFSCLISESNCVVRNAYCFVFGAVFWLFKQAFFVLWDSKRTCFISALFPIYHPVFVPAKQFEDKIWTWCYFLDYVSMLTAYGVNLIPTCWTERMCKERLRHSILKLRTVRTLHRCWLICDWSRNPAFERPSVKTCWLHLPFVEP